MDYVFKLLVLVVNVYLSTTEQHNSDDVYTMTIRMPNAVSETHDSLLCHAAKLDEEEAYIVRYEPHATKKIAHHMMVYGCGRPGSDQDYWSCASMDDRSDSLAPLFTARYEPHATKKTAHHMMVYGCGRPGSDQDYWSCASMDDRSDRSVCGDGERQIVWAWAMDADGRSFPEDVGFRVGGDTGIHYLVIQLHYAEKFIEYHVETACVFDKNYTIYPLAYRTHSHTLGVVTSGYMVRDNTWTEIGRMSPQLPQTFYNVTSKKIEVNKGDVLAARCTMSSQRTSVTKIGAEHSDEMCNFYIMYYTDYTGNLNIQYCIRDTQQFEWSPYLTNIPEAASSIHGLPPFTRYDPYADGN